MATLLGITWNESRLSSLRAAAKIEKSIIKTDDDCLSYYAKHEAAGRKIDTFGQSQYQNSRRIHLEKLAELTAQITEMAAIVKAEKRA